MEKKTEQQWLDAIRLRMVLNCDDLLDCSQSKQQILFEGSIINRRFKPFVGTHRPKVVPLG